MVFKYKKGDKVEVLMRKELPCSTWRCAELISGNGHTYEIRFTDSLDGGGRMARRFIRPSPPQGAVRDWVPGDIVEIFDSMSWKAAVVSNVFTEEDQYLVTLLGSSKQVRVHKSLVRVRQIWICDGWVVLGIAKSSSTSDWRCYHNRFKGTGSGDNARGKRKLREEDEKTAESVDSYDHDVVSSEETYKFELDISNSSSNDSSSSSQSHGDCEYIVVHRDGGCGYTFDSNSDSNHFGAKSQLVI